MSSPSTLRPPTSTTVSLPSIHEMFPDHLMRKDVQAYDIDNVHFQRGFPYPDSPGVHHPQLRHRVSIPESQCTCRSPCSHQASTHTDAAPTHSHVHQRTHESHPIEGFSPPNPIEGTDGFNVLRSSPTSTSSQRITSVRPPTRSNAQQVGCETVATAGPPPAFHVPPTSDEDKGLRHAREALPPRVSSSASNGSYPASSPRSRASTGIDPHAAVNSFPLSLPASSKQHHYYVNRSSDSGAHQYEQARSIHGFFQTTSVSGRGANTNEEDEDAALSAAEDNDISNGKKHVCPTCFKRFNRPSSLRIHVNTHTGATPFRCPWPNCGREFNVNSNMRRHYRNHTTPGFSRSQNSSNPGAANPHPSDGRRKRRRISAPQIPSPTSANNSSSSPNSSSYPPGYGPYRTDYQHRHPSQSSFQNNDIPVIYRIQQDSHHPQHHSGTWVRSPPISHLSVSDEDSSSGSESDVDEKYPAPQSHNYSKKNEDEIVDYEPDSSSLRYRTASLTRSLARVAVAPSSRKGHPYGLYIPGHTHPSAHATKEEATYRQSTEDGYTYSGHTQRPLTPGSSFQSSSPSPSTSPSPPPPHPQSTPNHASRLSAQVGYKYNASSPYMCSLADSRVSTTLRPAFGNSSERERGW